MKVKDILEMEFTKLSIASSLVEGDESKNNLTPRGAFKAITSGKLSKKEAKDALKVIANDTYMSFKFADFTDKSFPDGEKAIAKDPYIAYNYALNILKGPFPLAEKVISKDGSLSYQYALNVLKGPFPLGERAIAKHPEVAYRYSYYVLKKKPFPLGENAIARKPTTAYFYASGVLRGRFPKGEKTIMAHPHFRKAYINMLKEYHINTSELES